MQAARSEADQSNRVVQDAVEAMTGIENSSAQISRIISTHVSAIAKSASEQSNGIAEVNVGVAQLDHVAQKNASMVVEAMSVTQALQAAASELDGLMGQFAIKSRGQQAVVARRAAA